ncbi:uncharacterized protein LOC113232805 isoform X2 [Hyposmocoma kahamanoa]|uniref:uncharacterized protein LOC113232805 isoform X2 n=1 Tax=Hyposmocoma kahamanoa TaxID=1477025 RepID=UPI000E6D937F|nr:uncharacterized protein LOC113232805 isoform X2 [Hyposmocoma kahamanoa]
MCPEVFCNVNKLCGAETARGGCPYCSLSRRFSNRQSRSMFASAANFFNHRISSGSRMDSQFQKIYYESHTKHRILRNSMEYPTERKISSSQEDSKTTKGVSATSFEEDLLSQRSEVRSGAIKFCQLRSATGSITLPPLSTSPSHATQGKASKAAIHVAEGRPVGSTVVAACGKRFFYDSFTTDYSLPSNRCFQLRLGSPTKRHVPCRDVGTLPTNLAQQPQGASSDPESDRIKYRGLTRGQFADSVRQCNGSRVLKERRGHEVIKINESNPPGMSTNSRLTDCSYLSTSTRTFQLCGRSTVSRQIDTRVASPTRSDTQNISKIRYTSGGSLRISASPRSSPLRVPRPEGRGRSIPQCLQQAMGVPTSLGVSSSITHASGFDSPKQLQRPVYCSSPPLDKVVLETRSTEQSPQQASSNTRPTENSNRRNYQPTAPQGNRFDIESLADWSWDTLLKNWTPAEKAVLMNGWRKSTLMSYKPAWNRWVKWCLKNEVSIITPQAKDLAKFLADLHITEKLAPSTIQLHKSVVSTICEPHLNKKLSQDTFVRRVLKSVSVARPINRKVPIWDPQQVVQWLQNNVPINISFFEACRRCATILLLTSGRRVHDLTLLSISPGHIQEDNTNIILWPIFGSKTDTAQHQQSGWKLSPHDVQAICPVYWVKKVIELSKSRRGSLRPSINITVEK